MPTDELWSFVCQDCGDLFLDSPATNAWCPKCGVGHILCPACREVHELSASQQDRYLASLEN